MKYFQNYGYIVTDYMLLADAWRQSATLQW